MTKFHQRINLTRGYFFFPSSLGDSILYIHIHGLLLRKNDQNPVCSRRHYNDSPTPPRAPCSKLFLVHTRARTRTCLYSGCCIISVESLKTKEREKKKGPRDNQISGIAGLFASPTPDTRRIQISPLRRTE